MKPWQKTSWKKKRKEFLINKVCEWCDSDKFLTIHHPQKRNSIPNLVYESFEGTMILCRRCHRAIHFGKHLCPKCKLHYTGARFDVCLKCSEFEPPLPLLNQYKMPCGNFVMIPVEDIEFINPLDACLSYCGNDKIKGNYIHCSNFKRWYENYCKETEQMEKDSNENV